MKAHLNTLILAVTILGTAFVLAHAFQNRNQAQNAISVTGLGSKNFESDLIVWSGNFTRKDYELKVAYAELDKDRESIRRYLVSKGIKAEDIVFSSVEILKEFDNAFDKSGNITHSVFTGYRLRQNIQIESRQVDLVENVSRQVSELINSGIEFYSNAPEYYYTRLAALKIEMIAEATKDAETRARKIAENAGGRLGKLKTAGMGVFQIVAQNSSEEYSWGGSFNTTSKRKTATITVKLEYEAD